MILRRNKKEQQKEIQISEAELSAATKQLDEMHHELMPQMFAAANNYREELLSMARDEDGALSSSLSRRRVLMGGMAGAGALLLAACGSKSSSSSAATSTTAAATSGTATNLAVASLAASLENLAVGTYQSGLGAAQSGKLGTVPPAVATFVQTAMSQHKDHAQAWNSVLTGAGKPAVTGVDTTVKTAVVDPAFAQVKDVPGLAKLALTLENSAAATYLNGISVLSGNSAISTAATIQPVEMQHAAILNFILGQYPVPASFATIDGARSPSDQIG